MNAANGRTIRFWTKRKNRNQFLSKNIYDWREIYDAFFIFDLCFGCGIKCVIAAPQCWRLMGQFEPSIFEWDKIVTDDEQVLCNSHVSTAASMQNTSASGTTNACGIHNQCKMGFCSMPSVQMRWWLMQSICFNSKPSSNSVFVSTRRSKDRNHLLWFNTADFYQSNGCGNASKWNNNLQNAELIPNNALVFLILYFVLVQYMKFNQFTG